MPLIFFCFYFPDKWEKSLQLHLLKSYSKSFKGASGSVIFLVNFKLGHTSPHSVMFSFRMIYDAWPTFYPRISMKRGTAEEVF